MFKSKLGDRNGMYWGTEGVGCVYMFSFARILDYSVFVGKREFCMIYHLKKKLHGFFGNVFNFFVLNHCGKN